MDRVESYIERAETLQQFIFKKKGYDSGGHDDDDGHDGVVVGVNAMIVKGVEIVSIAIKADGEKNYELAFSKYKESLGYLVNGLECTFAEDSASEGGKGGASEWYHSLRLSFKPISSTPPNFTRTCLCIRVANSRYTRRILISVPPPV